uniref:Uncharacterized protein n=1 Tax=Oryza brachyantha TaxID=4533 RepID=J3NFC7_ORYBR
SLRPLSPPSEYWESNAPAGLFCCRHVCSRNYPIVASCRSNQLKTVCLLNTQSVISMRCFTIEFRKE